jgi:hypothetical protein
MSTADSPERFEFVVAEDGSIPAEQLARRGLVPGDRLGLIPNKEHRPAPRKRVRGILVGRIPPDEALTWEDFAVVHQANVDAAERRYGALG